MYFGWLYVLFLGSDFYVSLFEYTSIFYTSCFEKNIKIENNT